MLKNISVTLDVEDLRPSDNFEDRSKLMTEKVLDLFAEMKLRATIFVVGDIARKHPEIIKKAVKAGAKVLVSGSTIFKGKNYQEKIIELKNQF